MIEQHNLDEKHAAEQPAVRIHPAPHEKEKGITRCDYARNHGYRAYIKFKGKEYQRFFGDKGDPEEALARARHWRRAKLRDLQSSADADVSLKEKAVNNKSGITGVHCRPTKWCATWVEKGHNIHHSFSIEKYGEREAFRLACQERAEAEKRLYGAVIQPALQDYA